MAEQLAELNKGVGELTVETPSGVVKNTITTDYSVKKYGNVVTVCAQFTPTVLNTFQNVLEGLPKPAGVIYQVGTVNNSGTVNINAWISVILTFVS